MVAPHSENDAMVKRQLGSVRRSDIAISILASSFFLGSVGAAGGYLVTKREDDWNKRKKAAALGSIAGITLGVIFEIAKASRITNTRIQAEGLTETEISDTLENLRQIARIR